MIKGLIAFVAAAFCFPANAATYDVVVFGGSPSGVAAAVTVGDRGLDVALISQYPTVGGTISNGLGAADVGGNLAVTGFPMRFFQEIRDQFSDPDTWNVPPSDAEAIFLGFLDDANVDVFTEEALLDVERNGRIVECITTTSGEFCAKTFIDASYTGDLAHMAGVPSRIGYGDFFYYDELYVARDWQVHATLDGVDLSGAEAAFTANPFVEVRASSPTYAEESDLGRPSMTFRLCVTKEPANRVAFAQTANYETYADSWRRWINGYAIGGVTIASNGTIRSRVFQIAQTQDGKWDMNSGGGSFMNVPIPDGFFSDLSARANALDLLEDYYRNWQYFLQNDTVVPVAIRDAFADFGLCADEFTDNDNWPYEAYVREGRRIVGRDLLKTDTIYNPAQRVSPQSIGVGTYPLDSKLGVMLYHDGQVVRDSDAHLDTPWYEIPRGIIHPINIDNLMVTVNFSTTSRANGSVRMEPQYMQIGESAGAIAYAAHTNNVDADDAPQYSVEFLLDQNNAVVKLSDLCPLIPSRFRASAGFNATTCAPAPFTP